MAQRTEERAPVLPVHHPALPPAALRQAAAEKNGAVTDHLTASPSSEADLAMNKRMLGFRVESVGAADARMCQGECYPHPKLCWFSRKSRN